LSLNSVEKLIAITFLLQDFKFNYYLIIPNLFHYHYNFHQINYLFLILNFLIELIASAFSPQYFNHYLFIQNLFHHYYYLEINYIFLNPKVKFIAIAFLLIYFNFN